jgi:hypothetical protein
MHPRQARIHHAGGPALPLERSLKFTLTFWKLEDIIQIDREFLM